MRTLNRVSIAAMLCLTALSWSSPADAQTVPFKVYITELWQLDANVDPGLGYIGDYFAKVTINGVAQDNEGACDDTTSGGIITPFQLFKNFNAISECGKRTPWVFTQQVPAGQTVHVKIQLFDDDLAFDDEGDAKPGDGSALEFDVNPSTGQWSGDVTWPQTCSRPNLEGGGNNVNVCWQIGFDSDDDGLLDVWETQGVDTDNDGAVDLDLAALGASPLRKDIFLEIDHLQAATHTHAPRQDAILRIVTSFANAPVANPDGTVGVQLHADVGPLYGAGTVVPVPGAGGVTGTYGNLGGGNVIGEAGNEIIEALHDAQADATDFADLKSGNFNALREPIFRYTIFGHQTNTRRAFNDCTSGQASRTRRDFLVTLGGVRGDNSDCWTADINGHSVGSSDEQAGTLMHEMGHTLGLRHGGDVDVNNKPNYLSVMNYSFQDCQVPMSAGIIPGLCDYARLVTGNVLPDLDEMDLDECAGIGGGLGFGAVDWNGNGTFQGASQCGAIFANTSADINDDGVCVKGGVNGAINTLPAGDDFIKGSEIHDGPDRVCNTTAGATTDDVQVTAAGSTPTQPNVLTSFDDWARVTPGLIDFTAGYGMGNTPLDQEPDPETIKESRRYLGTITAPGIAIDESGPATGKPGDVLTYTAKITNTGRGPALSSVLKETSPDGTERTTALGTLAVGSETTQSISFTVPASACPGDFTGATAALSYKDLAGNAFSASDTAPLQILDVTAPSVDLTLTPGSLWAPNHKFREVTATITIKDNCDSSPVVTLVSITSNEAAGGVIGQGDKGPDVQGAAFGTDDRTFALRAERETGLDSTGRVYTVTYRVTDTSGNATVKSAIVTVPTSNSGK